MSRSADTSVKRYDLEKMLGLKSGVLGTQPGRRLSPLICCQTRLTGLHAAVRTILQSSADTNVLTGQGWVCRTVKRFEWPVRLKKRCVDTIQLLKLQLKLDAVEEKLAAILKRASVWLSALSGCLLDFFFYFIFVLYVKQENTLILYSTTKISYNLDFF